MVECTGGRYVSYQVFHPDMAALHQAEYVDAVVNRNSVFCSVTPLYNFLFSPGNPRHPEEPIRVSGAHPPRLACFALS
jgi:hypothetical protein